VIGASFDTPADNEAFADAQNFGFSLLSDVDRQVGEAYQVVRPEQERYRDFPRRVSYLIDPAGIIRRAYTVADVAGHAAQVLLDVALLSGRQ
jgi:peroxiredoxin Q/BCP